MYGLEMHKISRRGVRMYMGLKFRLKAQERGEAIHFFNISNLKEFGTLSISEHDIK